MLGVVIIGQVGLCINPSFEQNMLGEGSWNPLSTDRLGVADCTTFLRGWVGSQVSVRH